MGKLSLRQRETLQVPEKEDKAGRQADTKETITGTWERPEKKEWDRQESRQTWKNKHHEIQLWKKDDGDIYQSIFW